MELVENPFVSDFTRKTLAQFGWQPEDPIPAELGALLVRLKDALPASSRTDVLVDATLLSEDSVAAVKHMLETAKQVAIEKQKAAELENKTATMAPGVAALYKQLEAETPTIVDDRAVEAAPAPSAPPAQPQEEPQAPPPPPPEPTPPTAEDLPMLILPFCPRCGWDMRQKFEVTITDIDKEDFVAAMLGSTRFFRKFEILGGKMTLVFRSLLAEENRLIHRQLVLDQQDNPNLTQAEWLLRLMEYRLACSLEQITAAGGKPLHVIAPLAEFPYTPPADKPLQTALVPLLDYVNNKVLAHEVTRRLAGQHLRHFQRLVEALEAMALEPSFWQGIG